MNNVIWINGPVVDTWHIVHHCTTVPWRFKEYEAYMTVRNPYDRIISLYNHTVATNWPDVPRKTFEEFLDHLSLDIWFYRPQTWFQDNIECEGKVINSNYIKIEYLEPTLKSLGLKFTNLPRINAGIKNTTELSGRNVEKIQVLYGSDFHRYQYNEIP